MTYRPLKENEIFDITMAVEVPSNKDSDPEDSLLKNERVFRRKSKWAGQPFLCKSCVILITLGTLLAVLTFVVFPLILMNSIKLQRKFIFVTKISGDSEFEEFIDINEYATGIRNFYVTVNGTENVTLGVAHFLPLALTTGKENFDYSRSLLQQDYPVLLYFHGNGEHRFDNSDTYLKLRKFFHVISFDYRSYGDSSEAELTEEGIIEDSLNLYKWLRSQTDPDNIYVWGKSLGAALATHTLAKLDDENITSMGLVLEAPFTTLREEIEEVYFAKVFSWLPWFGETVLDGFEKNGFSFKTTDHILKVDSPIMILHAEDDVLIPYTLGEKLSKIAQEKRDPETQGNVTFHLFPAQFNYNHWGIGEAPELTDYVRDHIDVCEKYNTTKKNINRRS